MILLTTSVLPVTVPTELLAKYGLTVAEVAMLAGFVVAVTSLIKKHLHLQGPWLLLGAAVATTIVTALYYATIPKPLAAGLIILITAAGGWQTMKDVIGKFATGGTKPHGAGNRRVD